MDGVMSWFGAPGKDQAISADKKVVGNYTLGKVLGQGTFGVVRQGVHKTTGHGVAIKIIDHNKMDGEALQREAKIQAKLQHQHIVRILEIIEDDASTFIVMELVQSELFDYLLEHGRLKENTAKKLFSQIVTAVEHCHDSMIVHRDLKPENILIDENKNVKLADFGLATEWRKGGLLMESCGSPNYAAPELLHKSCQYEGPEIDVWSCGVILYVLLTNSLPFDEYCMPNLFRVIKQGQYKMPGYISSDAKDLIKGMLEVDRMRRLTIAQVRNHRWLASEMAVAVTVAPTFTTAQQTDVAVPVSTTAERSTTVSSQGSLAQPVRSRSPCQSRMPRVWYIDHAHQKTTKNPRIKPIGMQRIAQSTQHLVRVASAAGFIAPMVKA